MVSLHLDFGGKFWFCSVFKTKLKLKKILLILYFPAKNGIMVKSCFGVVETSAGQEKLRKGWK